MPAKHGHLFPSAPDWHAYSSDPVHPSLALRTTASPSTPIDVAASRAAQRAEEAAWSAAHSPAFWGYTKASAAVTARDGHSIPLATYTPVDKQTGPLATLVVTHGGGFFQGTPVTEERWLLAPLLGRAPWFRVVSVEYRLAPEHPFPKGLEDCEDVLDVVVAGGEEIFGTRDEEALVYLAGSSAGGGIAAALAQRARDKGQRIAGVVLNVPVLCHPGVFPVERYEQGSYEQCFGTVLTGEMMRQVWGIYLGEAEEQAKIRASPLLGDARGLPPHVLVVAGQDPLRDEGLAYAEILKEAGVRVELAIYKGLPHIFGEIWDLESTKRFQKELVESVEKLRRMVAQE
jgi:acetyl esterase